MQTVATNLKMKAGVHMINWRKEKNQTQNVHIKYNSGNGQYEYNTDPTLSELCNAWQTKVWYCLNASACKS